MGMVDTTPGDAWQTFFLGVVDTLFWVWLLYTPLWAHWGWCAYQKEATFPKRLILGIPQCLGIAQHIKNVLQFLVCSTMSYNHQHVSLCPSIPKYILKSGCQASLHLRSITWSSYNWDVSTIPDYCAIQPRRLCVNQPQNNIWLIGVLSQQSVILFYIELNKTDLLIQIYFQSYWFSTCSLQHWHKDGNLRH